MNYFNLYIELDIHQPPREKIEEVMTLAEMGQGLHPAIGTSVRGYLDATVTVAAESLVYAVMSTVATVQQIAGAAAIRVDVMTEAEFDARQGAVPMPELVGVTEAAELLGVSRQRVLQMVDENKLAGTKVGKSVVLAREQVLALGGQTPSL
jgi:excisionase family DNA binding protein